jgi:hypothetical protein
MELVMVETRVESAIVHYRVLKANNSIGDKFQGSQCGYNKIPQ